MSRIACWISECVLVVVGILRIGCREGERGRMSGFRRAGEFVVHRRLIGVRSRLTSGQLLRIRLSDGITCHPMCTALLVPSSIQTQADTVF